MEDKVTHYLQNLEQDRLEALRKRSPEEQVLGIIKILFEGVPGIGGMLSAALDEYAPDRQKERLILFVDDLTRRLGRLERKVKKERITPEHYGELLIDTLRLVAREHRQEKVEAYRAILLNTLTVPGVVVGEEEFFLTLVQDLSIPHIQMLRVLHEPQGSVLPNIRFRSQGGKLKTEWREILHRVFHSAPEGFVDAVWMGLYARGLAVETAYRDVIQHTTDSHQPGGVDHTEIVLERAVDALTPMGHRFVQFITDPASN